MSNTIESLEIEIHSNSEKASDGIDALTESLKKLKSAIKGDMGLSEVNKDLGEMSKKSTKASGSFTDVYHKIKSVANGFKSVGKSIYSAVEKSMDYTENMNLFKVSMGEYADGALSYAEQVSAAMGIDTSEWIRSQGIFMTMATGFGVAGDRAATMSKNLTQLGYDLSSFYNIDTETAMLKLKSGLAGELEPLRAIGYDLSQAKLEATALELGIDKSVSAMTQAEKAQLRYYAIMTQVTDAQGDMARTLDDPANQMRVFKSEINMAAREIGNMFIPALNAILPYLTATVKVVGALASNIAALVGFKESGIEETTKKVVENTDATQENLQDAQKEAKKLKSYMLGIDELNVINPNKDGATDSSEMFNFELPDYEEKFMEGLIESKVSKITKGMKDWLGITEDIKSWSDLISTNFGNIAVAVGIIGVGLAAWKVSKLLKELPKLKSYFTGFTVALKAMGITAVIAAATAGAVWLVKNAETTTEKIGGIISAAALAVGAILAFTGINLPLGIGLMAVGAVGMAAAIAMNTSKLSDEVKGVIAVITAAVSVALLAVGAILAFGGVNIPLGIALMAGGALTMATVVMPNWNSLSDSIKDIISIIMAAVGGASLVVGAILAFTGVNIPLGIGLMLVGAASLGTAIGLNWNALPELLQGPVGGIVAIISGALLGLGAILAFTGVALPLGIALMVLGAAGLATVVAVNWNNLPDLLRGPIGDVVAIISGALLALGTILAFTGVGIALGIALMAVGAAGLVTTVALNWNSIVDSIRGPVGEVGAIIMGAMIALGAILAFTGVGIPLGIALMLTGAAGLATIVALNWNSIVESLQGPVGKITAIVSGALLVLGAILLFTGVGIPLGLGLMLAGAAGLATVVAVNWDFIVDKIKSIWQKIKDFWNTYIAPVFTKEWWINLGKTCINGMIAGFEGGINGIIGAFESMINWIVGGLNKISFEVPDWVPGIGGKNFGFNIKEVSFARVSIPRFAEGGFPDEGQMFIAREAGAEMVGNIGRRTAVANNDQIVSGIAGGVSEANEEQNALLREQNSLLRAILDKESGVYLDGKNLTNSVEKYQRERGRVIITGGVL